MSKNILGRLSCCDTKLATQFKEENPETIGETDTCFDYGNYIEWLERKLNTRSESEKVRKAVEYINEQIEFVSLFSDDEFVHEASDQRVILNKIKSILTGDSDESSDN